MKNPLKISVITPSLNQGEFIERTINSVLSQGYHNLEYIIVDGGSTDKTSEIIKKYKNKIIYIHEKDKGQSDAINKGIMKSSGDILAYLNSDDVYLPDTLRKVNEFFIKNQSDMWVTGKCRMIDEKDIDVRSVITFWKDLWLYVGHFTRQSNGILKILNCISQPSTFWRKSVISKIGYFSNNYHYSMDYDYWLRLAKIADYGFINEYLSAFRIQKNSKSASNYKKQIEESMSIAVKYTDSKPLLILRKIHDYITFKIYNSIN
jgi:glycosyltransferase involved in cell wall biosynthesis